MLCGCSPARLLNGVGSSEYYTVEKDVAFGEEGRHKLDLYLPKTRDRAQPASVPVVVFVYGGGWRSGSRKNYSFVAATLTRNGYAVAIPDYGQYPRQVFPEFVDDVAMAVGWVHKQVAFPEIDNERIVLMGHSAGAQIAALIANDERYLDRQNVEQHIVSGWIGVAGPYDFLPFTRSYLHNVFPEPLVADSQPINFIDGDEPPALLLQGRQDTVVDPRNSIHLHDEIVERGGDVTLKLYDDIGHRRIIVAMSPLFPALAPTLRDTLQFLDRIDTRR